MDIPSIGFKPNLIQRITDCFKSRSRRLMFEQMLARGEERLSLEEQECIRKISMYKRLIHPVLSTRDQHTALENLRTSTSLETSGLALKLNFLNDFYTLTERRIINPNVIADNTSLYTYSGLDIELALLMGTRDLEMIDICFEEGLLDKFIDKMKGYRGLSQVSDVDFTFSFDYGNGEEKVRVKIIPKFVEEVSLTKEYGLILGFLSPHIAEDLNPQNHLIAGGYYINIHPDSVIDESTNIGTDKCNVYVNPPIRH